jgi:AraC-like DNA-binding protein
MSNAVSDPPASRTWFTPDLGLGCHYFRYTMSQYDGLAHMHGEYCFVACLSGEIDIGYREREEVVQRGEFTIVNPGEIHQCRFGVGEDRSSGLTVIIRPPILRALVGSMGLPLSGTGREVRFRGKQTNYEAFELIGKLIDELQSRRPGRETLLELLLRQILVYVVRSWPTSLVRPVELPLPPQLPWVQMHRATEFMNSHGKTSFRLTDLCVDVGLSASRFIPLFKNSSGISPHFYYNSLLVFKARRLLHHQRASTKEAAYALGFKNVSHFCALFHQLTGATPQADQARFGSSGADFHWQASGTGRLV